MEQCKESDWKLFRVKIVEWQTRYIERVNKKIAKVLTDEKLSAADRFWKAEKLLNREKNSAGVIVDMRRSTFKVNLLRLLKERSQSTGRFDGIQRGIAGRNPKNFGNVKKPT